MDDGLSKWCQVVEKPLFSHTQSTYSASRGWEKRKLPLNTRSREIFPSSGACFSRFFSHSQPAKYMCWSSRDNPAAVFKLMTRLYVWKHGYVYASVYVCKKKIDPVWRFLHLVHRVCECHSFLIQVPSLSVCVHTFTLFQVFLHAVFCCLMIINRCFCPSLSLTLLTQSFRAAALLLQGLESVQKSPHMKSMIIGGATTAAIVSCSFRWYSHGSDLIW